MKKNELIIVLTVVYRNSRSNTDILCIHVDLLQSYQELNHSKSGASEDRRSSVLELVEFLMLSEQDPHVKYLQLLHTSQAVENGDESILDGFHVHCPYHCNLFGEPLSNNNN